jgi:uncharacterized membrane protein
VRLRGASTAALGVAFLAAALGCSSSPSVATCPAVPADPPCPDAVPNFTQDIRPIFMVACDRCHSPTGEEPKSPLQTYQQINAIAGTVYYEVFKRCSMPPPSAPEILTDGQRQKLLDWFGCGWPDTGAPDGAAP